ncbi:MAG: DUF4827 family protein [Muribaculaceae bacterium]|nr:DUF4827 family protein [Muribaculaceae bacterium]
MMNIKKYFCVMAAAMGLLAIASCSNEVSYSDRLNTERRAVNAYLSHQRVVTDIPADTVFEVGPDAPYYRIDVEGNVYMQVIKAGDRKNDKVKQSETMYFRYTRYSLNDWHTSGYLSVYESNEIDMSAQPSSFKYMDFTIATSSMWGYGLQMPLSLLGAECEVNLIVKSQYGLTGEIAYVVPFLFHVRYFHSQI